MSATRGQGFDCPHCKNHRLKVHDTRGLKSSNIIRRVRKCSACAARFTTWEYLESAAQAAARREAGPMLEVWLDLSWKDRQTVLRVGRALALAPNEKNKESV